MRIGSGPSAQVAVRDVEARRTPAAMADVKTAITRALESQTGGRPNSRTVDVLAAQVSLETAHGGSMYNFNFGGIKGASPQGETANYTTREVLDGHSVTLQQGFRAYRSLDDGARDYVSVLRTRFPQAYQQAIAGNVDGFAHALKQSHYYTAPEAQYASGLKAAAGLPSGTSNSAPAATVASLPDSLATSAELSRVLDAIASTSIRIADPDPVD
jgi:hypothetical protein